VANAAILVLAPHPDDAEIAAFGLYAHSRAWVATVTAGERGSGLLPADIPASERSHRAAELRVGDSLTVPQIGEIPPERRVNLVYPDGALQAMFREPSREFALACEPQLSRAQLRARNPVPEFQQGGSGCTWDALVEDLGRLLAHSQPDIIVCPHPGDSHPDHVFTTVALERALSRSGGKRPLLLLYAVHHAAAPKHPFGPTDAVVGLPPGMDATWAVDAVYSLELGMRQLRGKRQALESMFATRWPGLFRRAWRPNEIYYVLRGEQLSAAIGQPGNA
jgi:LmbE family N-acetylglucosaminyl deacetylase